MKKVYVLSYFLLITNFLFAQPTIDGNINDSEYTTINANYSGDGFGSGNNISSLNYYMDGFNIYVGITCDLNSNNNIVLFFNFSGYGGRGSGTLAGTSSSSTGVFTTSNGGLDGAIMDLDQDFSGSEFFGANSDAKVNGNASWEYHIITESGSGGKNYVWTEGFGSGSSQGILNLSTSTDVIEASIPWSNLGGVPNNNDINFSFALVKLNPGNGAFDTGGENSKGDVLDYATQTSGNTYNTLIGFNQFQNNDSGQLDDYQTLSFNQSGTLPVKIDYYNTQIINNQILISWSTITEINNEKYDLYKSADGENWEHLKTIQAKYGRSEFNKSDYQVIDQKPYPGENYYKLTQTDYDGTITELGIESIQFEQIDVSIYPNPFIDLLNIKLPESKAYRAHIIDMAGRVISNHPFRGDFYQLDLQDVAPGQYRLNVLNQDDKLIQSSIITKLR